MHQSHSGSKPANGETDPACQGAVVRARCSGGGRRRERRCGCPSSRAASHCANRARRATEQPTRDRRWLPRGRTRFALPEKRGALRRRNAAERHNARRCQQQSYFPPQPRPRSGAAVRAAHSRDGTVGATPTKSPKPRKARLSRGVMALRLRCLPPPTRLRTRGWYSSPAAARDARGRPQAVGVFCPKELTARRRAS
jgi:hypothetical protein